MASSFAVASGMTVEEFSKKGTLPQVLGWMGIKRMVDLFRLLPIGYPELELGPSLVQTLEHLGCHCLGDLADGKVTIKDLRRSQPIFAEKWLETLNVTLRNFGLPEVPEDLHAAAVEATGEACLRSAQAPPAFVATAL